MPFVKLLIPFMAGIVLQWYFQFSLLFCSAFLFSFTGLFISFFFIPFFTRYKIAALSGLAITFVFIACGALQVWYNDIRRDASWFNSIPDNHPAFVAMLEENPVEKEKSFKATAEIQELIQNDRGYNSRGKVILYFPKGADRIRLQQGTRILFNKPLQEIRNSGNPGGFDYKRYCLFQQITHQAYLKEGDFIVLNRTYPSFFSSLIDKIRKNVLRIISTYIPGEKERGLAEALLIGYKDDLDKTLVQSYSNTGVVHIIAISGLHLGLIYWLLTLLLKPLQRIRGLGWLAPVLVITGLWLFSILAGAQPSILRSAVMFTCIVLGESLGRRSSIFNSLALSAFILLCYTPYWLWDVGFQLSYSAVLSIVLFMRPVYNWFYVKNKLLDGIWKMNAVTIAAQVLTLPVSIYHFHQFPNFFLFTNIIAVPLSSLLVLGEILLCAIAFLPPVAALTGKIIQQGIWFMNTWIERIEILPFSVWEGLYISIPQTILATIVLCAISYWLLEKQKQALFAGLLAALAFVTLRTLSFIQAQDQEKIIVYNIPKLNAMDILYGRNYRFVGDTTLANNAPAGNFHLRPSRVQHRVNEAQEKNIPGDGIRYFSLHKKHIIWTDRPISFIPSAEKQTIDLLVISKTPTLHLEQLADRFDLRQVVFDASVPPWKSKAWKKVCDSLHIPSYDVTEKGAFVMNLR